MTNPVSFTMSAPSTPAAHRPTSAPAAPADGFRPSERSDALPTRAAMQAAVSGATPASTPVTVTGAANGLPLQWTVTADGQITGAQNSLPFEAWVVPQRDGSVQVHGAQNGRGLYLELQRRPDGALSVEGRRTGRAVSYVMTPGREGLSVQGAQDGMTAGFTLVRGSQGSTIQGGIGGFPAGVRATTTGGHVVLRGGAFGKPLEAAFAGNSRLEQLGDFLPGLSTDERTAMIFILLTAPPR